MRSLRVGNLAEKSRFSVRTLPFVSTTAGFTTPVACATLLRFSTRQRTNHLYCRALLINFRTAWRIIIFLFAIQFLSPFILTLFDLP